MTKIYIYCLFDEAGYFHGVYSSLKAVHRDAIKLANKGKVSVHMELADQISNPTLTGLRNAFKGKCDLTIRYRGGPYYADITKTKLKE
tara:strand:+ start:42 stop:305 length:264 start_codon:yes stop_codon:yes gene_type:complete